MAKPDGGPAFPTDHSNNENYTTIIGGMSLRDYFAAQAIAALNVQAHVEMPGAEQLAHSAYEIADAMLRERET